MIGRRFLYMANPSSMQRRNYQGKDVGLPAIETLGWGRHSAARQALTPHEHGNAYEICFIADGSVQWWVEDEIHTVEAGQIYLTKPGETHGGIDDIMHPCELFWLIFTLPKRGSLPGLTPRETSDLGKQLTRFTQRRFDASPALESAYRTMLSAFADKPDHQQLVIRTALHQLLLELVRCHDRHTHRHESISPQIAQAMQWINKNASENFNLDAVAETVGLGISQFHARFRKETGLTPARYRTRQRIEQAKRLLRDTTRPVTDIALTCGFATSQYFATVFRQQVGMHARAYREKLNAKTPAS